MSCSVIVFEAVGNTPTKNKFNMHSYKVPELPPLSARVRAGPRRATKEKPP
jgi:hypothetical protein